ncbi:MAG: hypothetical protein ACYC6I_08700 [Bacillota bacterium]
MTDRSGPVFNRYALVFLAALAAGEALRMAFERLLPGTAADYLFNDVLLVYRYGLFVIIAQAYLAGHWFLLYHPALGALWRTSALDAAFYLHTRVAEDLELDKPHCPGRRSIPQGG